MHLAGIRDLFGKAEVSACHCLPHGVVHGVGCRVRAPARRTLQCCLCLLLPACLMTRYIRVGLSSGCAVWPIPSTTSIQLFMSRAAV